MTKGSATAQLVHGDCIDEMRKLVEAGVQVDAVVCDPPYGLSDHGDITPILAAWIAGETFDVKKKGFMGKTWDGFVPCPEYWKLCHQLLKPGGHLVAFAGARTSDLMGIAVRLAGFEVRDVVSFLWSFGSGFPKSHDVSKTFDRAAGATRDVVGHRDPKGSVHGAAAPDSTGSHKYSGNLTSSEGVSPAAKQWEGWGTALKPAYEPILLARKPLVGTVAENVLAHETGAINIGGCRVGETGARNNGRKASADYDKSEDGSQKFGDFGATARVDYGMGRWPANLCHDGSDEVLAAFAEFGNVGGNTGGPAKSSIGGNGAYGGANARVPVGHKDVGTAARFFQSCPLDTEDEETMRFFYSAKAQKRDRDEGLDDLPSVVAQSVHGREEGSAGSLSPYAGVGGGSVGRLGNAERKNIHPTVKPTDLMRWLCRLVTPPGGTVLDPFMGSGSTGKAARLEGFSFIGVEREAEYMEIARRRIAWAEAKASEGIDGTEVPSAPNANIDVVSEQDPTPEEISAAVEQPTSPATKTASKLAPDDRQLSLFDSQAA